MTKRLLWACIAIGISTVMLPIAYMNPSIKSIPIIELVGIFVVVRYILQLHKAASSYLYTSFYQIYSLLGVAISLLFIGAGIPMIEVDQEGSANGAIWVALIFLVVGLESGKLGYEAFQGNWLCKTKLLGSRLLVNSVYFFSTVVLMIGLFILFKYGGAAFSGVTRVAFWNSVVPGEFRLYPSLLGQTFFLGAFLYLARRREKVNTKPAILIVVCYVLATIIIVGEKFSTLIIYLTVWLALYAGFFGRMAVNAKTFALSATLLGFLLMLVELSYIASDREAIFVMYRIATQAELLWSVFTEDIGRLALGGDWLCYISCGHHASGSDYISARYVSSSLWNSYVESGSALSGFLPALPILTFGIVVALLMHVAISFLFGVLQKALVEKIKAGDLVMSFLAFKIYFGLLGFWYAAKLSALPGVAVTMFIMIAWMLAFKAYPRRAVLINTINDVASK